jgi:hypothetical protein
MFSIPFEADKAISMSGLQMGISFDKDAVEFLGVYGNGYNVTGEYINEEYLEYGEIVFSWNSTQSIEIDKDEAVFELRFASKQEVMVDEIISLNPEYLASEIYSKEGDDQIEIMEVRLDTRESKEVADELILYQNVPNPFDATSEVRFSLPKDAKVAFDIFDIAGRSIYHSENVYKRGLNKISISEDMLDNGGVYFYQVADGANVVRMKMIYIK